MLKRITQLDNFMVSETGHSIVLNRVVIVQCFVFPSTVMSKPIDQSAYWSWPFRDAAYFCRLFASDEDSFLRFRCWSPAKPRAVVVRIPPSFAIFPSRRRHIHSFTADTIALCGQD